MGQLFLINKIDKSFLINANWTHVHHRMTVHADYTVTWCRYNGYRNQLLFIYIFFLNFYIYKISFLVYIYICANTSVTYACGCHMYYNPKYWTRISWGICAKPLGPSSPPWIYSHERYSTIEFIFLFECWYIKVWTMLSPSQYSSAVYIISIDYYYIEDIYLY